MVQLCPEETHLTTPGGSPLRAQEILAELGYLPLTFTSEHRVGHTAGAQETAAIDPPKGSFAWRWSEGVAWSMR